MCTADGVVGEVGASGGGTAGSADHAGITTTGVALATSGAAHTTGASIGGHTALPALSEAAVALTWSMITDVTSHLYKT